MSIHCKKEDRAYKAYFKKVSGFDRNAPLVTARMSCVHQNCKKLVKNTLSVMLEYYQNSITKQEKMLKAEKDPVRRKWIQSIIKHAKSEIKRLSKINADKITIEDVKSIMLGS